METKFSKQLVRPIPGYEGYYSASIGGRIYCHARKGRKGRWLKERPNTTYSRVPLSKEGIRVWHHVQRLIALTFIPNPENKPQVNHKNMNKHDNSVKNLEWVTWRENWEHARDHGSYRGNMLSEQEQVELYQQYQTGQYTYDDLAEKFRISTSSVYRHIVKLREQPPMLKAA